VGLTKKHVGCLPRGLLPFLPRFRAGSCLPALINPGPGLERKNGLLGGVKIKTVYRAKHKKGKRSNIFSRAVFLSQQGGLNCAAIGKRKRERRGGGGGKKEGGGGNRGAVLTGGSNTPKVRLGGLSGKQ